MLNKPLQPCRPKYSYLQTVTSWPDSPNWAISLEATLYAIWSWFWLRTLFGTIFRNWGMKGLIKRAGWEGMCSMATELIFKKLDESWNCSKNFIEFELKLQRCCKTITLRGRIWLIFYLQYTNLPMTDLSGKVTGLTCTIGLGVLQTKCTLINVSEHNSKNHCWFCKET